MACRKESCAGQVSFQTCAKGSCQALSQGERKERASQAASRKEQSSSSGQPQIRQGAGQAITARGEEACREEGEEALAASTAFGNGMAAANTMR